MKKDKTYGEGLLEMELSDYMAEIVKDQFNLEIEFLQGTKEKLPNGLTKYVMKITDPQKSEMIVKFCLHIISNAGNPGPHSN